MNSTKHRTRLQKADDQKFIALQSWNTKLLLQAGQTYYTSPSNAVIKRTPKMRLAKYR